MRTFVSSLKGRNFSMSVKKGRVGERKSTGVQTEGAYILKRRERGQEAVLCGHLYSCGDGQASSRWMQLHYVHPAHACALDECLRIYF